MNLTIDALHHAYDTGALTPAELIAQLLAAEAPQSLWITRLGEAQIQPYLDALAGHSPQTKPLYGIPFAVKDNIDLAGVPTTAGCPAYIYTPTHSAFVVDQLIAAGAIPLGKTTLDQFATGLVGERSPAEYGAPGNAFDADYIPGGSSSGSAIAVAAGHASFALGTDTAGSGRVPASFNNLFGLKPTRGLFSTAGVVPACATLDTISVFSLTADDGEKVFTEAARPDPACAWSREYHFAASGRTYGRTPAEFFFGVPSRDQWQTDPAHTEAMETAIKTLESLGGRAWTIDATPFLEAAELLYQGPWVTERYLATRKILEDSPDALLPVTRQIVSGGSQPSAADAFAAQYRLSELKRQAEMAREGLDFILTPTVVTHPTKAAVADDPVGLNSQLGRWTNFMNLLDYSALSVPMTIRDGRPQGVTLFSDAFDDLELLSYARAIEAERALPLGATDNPRTVAPTTRPMQRGLFDLVVCGAHLEGLALNHQLTERGGQLLARAVSAPNYRLLVLPGTPKRPAMVADATNGRAIEVEVWRLPTRYIGSLLALIGAPLGLGRVTLADGRELCGFIAAYGSLPPEPELVDITGYGGWRAWLADGQPDA